MADPEYRDRWIECTGDAVRIHAYYFPWGTKRVWYSSIKAVEIVDLSAARGRARIWGTANLRYWAGLDPQRPRKAQGIILDLGRRVRPFLTPDDPAAVVDCIHRHTGLQAGRGRGPII